MQVDKLRAAHPSLPFQAFGLSSEHCELLLGFEETGSLAQLASRMGRDISVVSRQLQKVARTAPVLEKIQGKWRITALGREISHWTRNSILSQKRLLQQRTSIRIATTREFAARVLAPQLHGILPRGFESTHVTLTAAEGGIEGALLAGEADFGFDCGRPNDPSIRFKAVQTERFAPVTSPAFLKRHSIRRLEDLIPLPHLQYRRAAAPAVLQLSQELPSVVADFNDIASTREACLAGLGWAVLPRYAVRRELDRGELRELPLPPKGRTETFGIWWLRDRSSLDPWIEAATKWLSGQEM